MFKDVWKRVAALFLCACLVGTSVDLTGFTVFAAEEQRQEAESQQEEAVPDEVQPQTEEAVPAETQPQAEPEVQEESKAEEGTEPKQAKPKDEETAEPQNTDTEEKKDETATMGEKEQSDSDVVNGPFASQSSTQPEINALPENSPYTVRAVAAREGEVDLDQALREGNLNIQISLTAADQIYTGKTKSTPTVNVLFKNNNVWEPLTRGTHYTINWSPTTIKDAGTVTVQIIGVESGGYTGTASKSYEIAPLDLANDVILDPSSTPGLTVVSGSYRMSYPGSDNLSYQLRTRKDSINLDIMDIMNDTVQEYKNIESNQEKDFTKDVGQKRFKIKANSNNCTGELTFSYRVTEKSLQDGDISVDIGEVPLYTGTAVEPVVTVYQSGVDTPLVKDTDYTVNYSNNTSIGSNAKVTLRGKGNYTGVREEIFEIAAKDLSDYEIEFDETTDPGSESSTPYTYEPGKSHRPKVKVTDLDGSVLSDKDYDVSYQDNDKAGTAKVIITGKRSYTGTAEKEFYIKRRDIKEAVGTDNTNVKWHDQVGFNATENKAQYTYTGTSITPEIDIVDNGKTLVKNTDYTTLSNSINVNAGGHLQVTGTNNYEGTVDLEFEILARDLLSTMHVKVDAGAWTDTALPTVGVLSNSVHVTYDGQELSYLTDYTFEIYQSMNPDGKTGVDLTESNLNTVRERTAYILIKPAGNESGANYKNYRWAQFPVYGDLSKIKATSIQSIENIIQNSDCQYTGEGVTFGGVRSITSEQGNELLLNTHFKLEYNNNVNVSSAGSRAEVIIRPVSGASYAGECRIPFDVQPRSLDRLNDKTIFDYSITTPVYNGTEQLPEVSITLKNSSGGLKLVSGRDFEIVPSADQDYTSAGTGKKIKIKGKDGSNFTGEFDTTYEISPRSIGDGRNPALDITTSQLEEAYEFTGKKISPADTLKIYKDGSELSTSDYKVEVTGGDGIHAGISTITVSGQRNYKDSFQMNYRIKYPLDKIDKMWASGEAVHSTGVPLIEYTDENGDHRGFEYQGGRQVVPELIVKFDVADVNIHNTLRMGPTADYEIVSTNSSAVGKTATVTIEGRNDYMGQMTVTFEVVPKDIGSDDIQWGTWVSVDKYNGKPRNPETGLKAAYGDDILENGNGFNITKYEDDGDNEVDRKPENQATDGTGSKCIHAGKVTVTITGTGNYRNTTTMDYTIPKKELNASDIQIGLKDGNKVSWIQGEIYDGNSRKLPLEEWLFRYAGAGPDGSGIDLNKNIEERQDFEIISIENTGDKNYPPFQMNSDSDCINAGTITVTFQATVDEEGRADYQGMQTVKYEIKPKSLGSTGGGWTSDIQPKVSVGEIASDPTGTSLTTTYNREVQNPTIQLFDTRIQDEDGENRMLDEDLDYTVKYEKFVNGTTQEVKECKDAGEYWITVEGKGNYESKCRILYTILPRNLNTEEGDYRFAIAPIDPQVYTGSEIIPESLKVFEYTYNADEPENKENETYTLLPGEFKVEGKNNLNATPEDAGEDDWPTLTITGNGNYVGTLTTKFKILPKNINDKNENGEYDVKMLEILQEEYCAKEIEPSSALPLQYNNMLLEEGEDKDYILKYELTEDGETEAKPTDHTNVGPVYGTVTGIGNYTGTRKFNEENGPLFEIVPRSIGDAYTRGEVKCDIEGETGLIYDGLPHKPIVTLTDTLNKETVDLVLNKDYTVDYDAEGIDAGERTITITGINNYRDDFHMTYTIAPKQIVADDGEMISGSSIRNILNLIYTGDPLTQEPVITDTIRQMDENGNISNVVATLQKQSEEEPGDYEVICTNNINATTEESLANVEVRFHGNYSGIYRTTFSIAKRDIAFEEILIDEIPDQEYNQNPIQYQPRITYGKTEDGADRVLAVSDELNERDYALSYSSADNNECIQNGTVTITITGTGNFTGSRTITYEIVPKSLGEESDIQLTRIANQFYTGTDIVEDIKEKENKVKKAEPEETEPGEGEPGVEEPEELIIQLTDGEKILEWGVDFDITPVENTVGPGMAVLQIEGKGNYSGTRNAEFRIVVNLGTSPIDIEEIPVQSYTGAAVTPRTVISFNGTELVETQDYNVSWADNINSGVDTAKLIVEGTGDEYVGKREIPFTIAYMLSDPENPDEWDEKTLIAGIANEYTYTSGEIMPSPVVSYDGRELQPEEDYTLDYMQNVETGTATIIVTGMNGYMGSVTQTFRIVKKNLANCTYSAIGDYVFDGKAKAPGITVRDNGRTLVAGRDYSLAYSNNTEAGVGQVIVTGMANSNYTGTVIRYFNIRVAQPTNLKMSSNSKDSIKLSWKAGGRATGYEIYRMDSKGKYKRIATTTSTSYTNKKLGSSKVYQYRIRAYSKGSKGNVYSNLTNAVAMNTKPGTPNVTLSSTKKNQMKISWKKLNSAGGYEVYQKTSKKGKYKKVATITKGSTKSYTQKKLTSGKTYWYKVRAYKTINGKKVNGSYSSVKSKKVK